MRVLVLGVTLLGEEPGVNAYAGLALILAGIALTQWRLGHTELVSYYLCAPESSASRTRCSLCECGRCFGNSIA